MQASGILHRERRTPPKDLKYFFSLNIIHRDSRYIQYNMKLTYDPWQRDFLATEGDKILCTGRQVGKSVICGHDAGEWAANNNNKTILMIAPTERQAYALFDKTLDYLITNYPKLVRKGRDRPTKSKIQLKNKTIIHCLPTGVSGSGIRFLTVHRLYVDEASRVPDEVWAAVTPMLLTTGGDTILLSTPAGKQGEFYRTWIDEEDNYKSFKRFSVTSLEVVKEREICNSWTEEQREKAIERLERERARMGRVQFAQEYIGQFMDELSQFFPDALINRICIAHRDSFVKDDDYYLGVDVARMGEDESTFEIIRRSANDNYIHMESLVTRKTLTTETTLKILKLEKRYCFKKIYIDDGGMGVAVFDQLLQEDTTKRKVVAINNAKRSLERDTNRSKKLLKEDLYNNLLRMMELSKVLLLNDDEVKLSLRSIQAEYSDTGVLKIWGSQSHITEGLIRACWCVKDKPLNISIHYI